MGDPQKNVIKEWAPDDRPREKFIQKGHNAVSDSELLAILMGSGTRQHSAVELGRLLLHQVDGDLSRLAGLSIQEICRIPGIGNARAVSIAAAIELGRRRQRSPSGPERNRIGSSQDVFRISAHHFLDLKHEEFRVLFLNRGNFVIADERISAGGMTGTIVDPRIIMKKAILHEATSLVLLHNHPSGNLKPSEADLDLTRRLRRGGQDLDINILDHLIVHQALYYSFADNGLL